MLGAALGVAFGAWNLILTMLDPLAEDTPTALARVYGPMFTIWGLAGFAANYVYFTGAPFKILVAALIGAASGRIGGLMGSIFGPRMRPLTSRSQE